MNPVQTTIVPKFNAWLRWGNPPDPLEKSGIPIGQTANGQMCSPQSPSTGSAEGWGPKQAARGEGKRGKGWGGTGKRACSPGLAVCWSAVYTFVSALPMPGSMILMPRGDHADSKTQRRPAADRTPPTEKCSTPAVVLSTVRRRRIAQRRIPTGIAQKKNRMTRAARCRTGKITESKLGANGDVGGFTKPRGSARQKESEN